MAKQALSPRCGRRRFFFLCCLLLTVPVSAQTVFPGLLPPEAVVVVSVPEADGAWRAFQETRFFSSWRALSPGLSPWTAAGKKTDTGVGLLGSPLEEKSFWGEVLSASELAILPGEDGGGPVFLLLGQMRDVAALRSILNAFEEKAAGASAPRNPVTRQEESINQTALVLFTDSSSSIGYFLNGPHAVCAFSNDAETLRRTARRLESSAPPQPGVPSAPAKTPDSFSEMLRAWKALQDGSSAGDFHVRFFIAPPRNVRSGELPKRGAAGLDPLLEALQPRGGMAGGLRFGPEAVRVESFALFPQKGASLVAELYRSAPLSEELPGARAAAPDAMLISGNNLFDVPALKRYLVQVIDRWSATIPEAASGVSPASARTQAHLALLRGWFSDPTFLAELGPRWFFALNNFEFTAPGEFPRIDCLAGIQTRNPSATETRMFALEKDLVDAATAYFGGQPDAPTTRSASVLPGGSEGSPKTRPHFSVAERLMPGGKLSSRFLVVPGFPQSVRPAWSVFQNHLLIALAPETIERAADNLREREPSEISRSSANQYAELRARCGMERVHAYQVVRADRAGKAIRAIVETLVARRDPSLKPQVARLAAALEPIQTLLFFRRGQDLGVRTVGEIVTAPAAP